MRWSIVFLLSLLSILCGPSSVLAFARPSLFVDTRQGNIPLHSVLNQDDSADTLSLSRRDLLRSAASASSSLALAGIAVKRANAAVGSLPEFQDTNAIIQGLTVDVADKSQQDSMVDFLVNGFDFQILRKRIKGSVEETVSLSCSSVSFIMEMTC